MAYRTGAERPRWFTLAVVMAMHGAALVGLVHAFAPDLGGRAVLGAQRLISIALTPPPSPPMEPSLSSAPRPQPDAGAVAPPAPRASPRPVVAPRVATIVPRVAPPAPAAASSGEENRSGAETDGDGTGGGGAGQGTGSGGTGDGQGGSGGLLVTRPVKVAGDISDARDYPTPPGGRDVRRGQYVVVYMTVGVDGRARDCRVVEPSTDPAADRRTCELAEQRFRFRPARNAAGDAVPAVFGWRQEWF